jgi:subtilisin family serine protease
MKRSTWAVVLTAIILLVGIEIGIADSPYSEHIIGVGNETLYEDYRGLEEFGVVDAWKMGYTGKEVKVAIIDTGIDFATPDLIGTQARIENEDSPYYGWPIVIDLKSLSQYQKNNPYPYNYQYANTSVTDTEGYIVTGNSKSGVYHIGDHPDEHLTKFYGAPVKVLVADEEHAEVYDTVYVDLNNNHDFSDDKPCRKGDEVSYWDKDNDSYPDESGGMIYFIADGNRPLPFSQLFYGEEARIPETGELIAFHFDPGTHGTMCASIVAAHGKNVKGIAPGARLIPVRTCGENDMLLCLIASLGYDGIANTGDEANIISRSGSLSYFNKGADKTSVFLEYLTTEVSPYTTIVCGNGNYGSGYGTCGSPSSEHVINVGAIYDLWWDNSSYRGDVTCFSSRGPNALGQVKPNVLATGYFTPASRPLWFTHDGKAAWAARGGGGTSGATPHVSAVVALIYQAYKETEGEFPASEKARDILMSAATDINEEVFAQGSGIMNAKRAVKIASRRGGALIEPALFVTSPVEAGSTLDFEFTISNYSDRPIALNPQRLIKEATKTFSLDLTNESILFPVDNELLDCDLLKVSFYYPRNTKDTKLEEDEGYILYLYNWRDLNNDSRAGPEEGITLNNTQKEELESIAIGDWGSGFTSEARMHDPGERTDDGLFIGLDRRGETESKAVSVVVETYNWQKWDMEIDVRDNKVSCVIPAPEETGVYQGEILLDAEGVDGKQCIPISFATYRNASIKIGTTQEIYENGKLYGRFEGDGKHGSWDSRFYPIYNNGSEIVTIDVTWEDPNTDIDVYLYGEGVVDTSKLWEYPTKSPIELPVLSVLKENGHSMRVWRTIMGEGFMGMGYGLSYSKFYTSTGKNSEVIAGELTDGLNILVLNQVISGGNVYGENVGIRTNITSPEPIELAAEAGETIKYRSPCVDGIIGFSSGREGVAGGIETFEAKQGDVLLLRSNGTYYRPHLFFDSNGNETRDWDTDEIVFAERRVGYITHLYTDIIPIPRNGTYFFMVNLEGKLYHMTEKYVASPSSQITIQAPKEAGTYLGLCAVNGKVVPVPVILEVEPLEPAQIELKAPEIIGCNLPFELEIRICDRYGNLVEINTSVTVILENRTEEIEIVNGTGSVTLNAPETEGEHAIRVEGNFDAEEIYIKATQKPLIDLDSTLNDVVLRNKGGAGIELNLYINPSGFDSVNPVSLKEYTPTYHRKSHLGPGEEEHFDLTGYQAEYYKQKQSVHPSDPIWKILSSSMTTVTDNHSDILLYEGQVSTYGFGCSFGGPGIEELKKIEQIKSVYSDEPITFEAYGVISIQHNESQPLFFVTNGDFSVIPGTPGKLTVRMENETHIVEVLPAATKEMVEEIVLLGNGKQKTIDPKSEEGIGLASLLTRKLHELNLQARCVFSEEDIRGIKQKDRAAELVFKNPIDIRISQLVEPEERYHIPDEKGYRILKNVETALFILEDILDEGLEAHILVGSERKDRDERCSWNVTEKDREKYKEFSPLHNLPYNYELKISFLRTHSQLSIEL